MAVITEMALDNGRRASAALAAASPPEPFDNSGPPYTLDGMDPVLRDLIVNAVHGAMATSAAPPAGHWLTSSWQLGRAISASPPETPVPQSEPAEFWLIERGPNQGQLPHVWWVRSKPEIKGGYEWTETAVKATRFATKDDAEETIKSEYLTHCVATSHSIIDRAAPPSSDGRAPKEQK